MNISKEYIIPFIGLKLGNHQFHYHIDNTFFKSFDYDEFNDCDVNITIKLEKKNTLLELSFFSEGIVNLPCDVTNELFDQTINGDFHLIVKFGLEYNDDNEEILILPQEAYEIDIAQYIYELIVLSVPSKRVHPDVLNGTMKHDALDVLEKLNHNKKTVDNTTTDPRWDKLKDLLTGKNR